MEKCLNDFEVIQFEFMQQQKYFRNINIREILQLKRA